MNNMLAYIIKSNLLLVIFLVFFFIFCRKSYYFKLNRFVLLMLITSSLILPLIQLEVQNPVFVLNKSQGLSEIVIKSTNLEQNISLENSWNLMNFIKAIYILGCAFSLIKIIFNFLNINKLKLEIPRAKGCKIVISNKIKSPFSFLDIIYLPSQEFLANDMIMKHELAHVQQKHSLDILFILFVKIFYWYNPILIIYLKLCKENHEYLADRAVVRYYNRKEYGTMLLQQIFLTNQFKYVHQFNSSLLKNRLLMLRKKNSSFSDFINYSVAVAFFIFIFVASAVAQTDSAKSSKNIMDEKEQTIYTIVGVMPKYGVNDNDLFNYLSTNIKYPQSSRDLGAEGMVILNFIVGKDSKLYNVKIARSTNTDENFKNLRSKLTNKTKTDEEIKASLIALDNEAIRVIESMDKWMPGQQAGENVNVRFTLPVKFKLD